jgi:hypothetical protein
VLSRISLKLVLLIIKELRYIYNSANKGQDPQWFTDHLSAIQCESRISSYLPTGLFTIAILINSVRWLHLIRVHQQSEKQRRLKMAE